MTLIKRRDFLKTSLAAPMVAAGLGPSLSFAQDPYSKNIFVFVFQRGGIDGLSFLTPMDGHPDRGFYQDLRPLTAIPSTDLEPLSGGWGLHPAAAPLKDLWNQQDLAIVQAVGLPWANRSHFEAERYVELGTPGNRFTQTGWLTRHMQTALNIPEELLLPAIITESTVRYSFFREPTAVTMRYPQNFDLDSSYFEEEQEVALAEMYAVEGGELDIAGAQAMAAMELIEQIDFSNYVPAPGAVYPARPDNPARLTSFGEELKIIAQLIKEGTGVRLAQTDIGGWDTHNTQGNETDGGYFLNVRDLAESINAFFRDLDVPANDQWGGSWADRTTMIVYSEFGRRVFDNADAGTDHGWGNNCLCIGGGVNGGQFYGDWLGLHEDFIFQGADVWATTDFRSVFGEMLLRRLHNNKLGDIFPGFDEADYQPLGIFDGALLQPDFNDPDIIFRHGSE
jgi:uncharacterized protein (DUF1501 family)